MRPLPTAASAVAAPGFNLLLPTPKSEDQKTPGMALRQGADRNHAWPRAPNNVDPHSGVRSRAIFSGQAGEKREDGPVIPAVSL